MDCDLCQIRSSIGYCAECKRLLCEMCGIACTECGKNICVTHVHETRSGKRLCSACTKARKDRQRRHAESGPHEKTSFEDLDQPHHAAAHPSDEDEDDEDRALTASAYRVIPPWKLSLYSAAAAAAAMILVLAVPSFRLIAQPWCSIVSVTLCAISGFWAFTGLTSINHLENRPRNFIGASISVIALLMALAALKLDTNTRGTDVLDAGRIERQQMSPQELQNWRRRRLDKFTPQQTAPANTQSAPPQ